MTKALVLKLVLSFGGTVLLLLLLVYFISLRRFARSPDNRDSNGDFVLRSLSKKETFEELKEISS